MRNYKKKTNRGEVPKEVYVAAAKEIMEENKHLRPVADKYGINFMTLQRYVKRCQNFKATGNNNNMVLYFSDAIIFVNIYKYTNILLLFLQRATTNLLLATGTKQYLLRTKRISLQFMPLMLQKCIMVCPQKV